MKRKEFTPTKAPLPQNEMLLGGDASPKLFKKRDVKKVQKEYEEYLNNKSLGKI